MKVLYAIIIICSLIMLSSCSGCSQSGRRQLDSTTENRDKSTISRKGGQKTIVKMEKKNGVYHVPIEINGINMYFIFDTGAGMISISETEANFLYKQGTLDKNDILGSANFIDAQGDISEGTIINLKTVKIGNKTLTNIKASVVHNLNAPLLLGQTALETFGKISIDNKGGEITFE